MYINSWPNNNSTNDVNTWCRGPVPIEINPEIPNGFYTEQGSKSVSYRRYYWADGFAKFCKSRSFQAYTIYMNKKLISISFGRLINMMNKEKFIASLVEGNLKRVFAIVDKQIFAAALTGHVEFTICDDKYQAMVDSADFFNISETSMMNAVKAVLAYNGFTVISQNKKGFTVRLA